MTLVLFFLHMLGNALCSLEIAKKQGISCMRNTVMSVFRLQDHFGYNSLQFGITWYNSVQLSTIPFNSFLKPNKTELYRVVTWFNSVQLSTTQF